MNSWLQSILILGLALNLALLAPLSGAIDAFVDGAGESACCSEDVKLPMAACHCGCQDQVTLSPCRCLTKPSSPEPSPAPRAPRTPGRNLMDLDGLFRFAYLPSSISSGEVGERLSLTTDASTTTVALGQTAPRHATRLSQFAVFRI